MTLVEIMISLLIGAFLIGGILQVFSSSKQTYGVQEGLSRLQENGRFAIKFIAHDIRMIDYWGCMATGLGGISNNLNFVADDPFDFASGAMIGTQGTIDGSVSALDLSDSITIRGASGSWVLLTTAMANQTANLSTSAHEFIADDLIYITDCNKGDIFQASSGVAANTDISHAAGLSAGENQTGNLSKSYGVGAQIFKVSTVVYSIQQGNGGQPGLFRQKNAEAPVELIEGIENMQILYGEDTNADRTPDYYVSFDNIADINNVVSIQISLLVASNKDNLVSEPLSFTYNGATTIATDRRLRRVFTSTIAVRNRLP